MKRLPPVFCSSRPLPDPLCAFPSLIVRLFLKLYFVRRVLLVCLLAQYFALILERKRWRACYPVTAVPCEGAELCLCPCHARSNAVQHCQRCEPPKVNCAHLGSITTRNRSSYVHWCWLSCGGGYVGGSLSSFSEIRFIINPTQQL